MKSEPPFWPEFWKMVGILFLVYLGLHLVFGIAGLPA